MVNDLNFLMAIKLSINKIVSHLKSAAIIAVTGLIFILGYIFYLAQDKYEVTWEHSEVARNSKTSVAHYFKAKNPT